MLPCKFCKRSFESKISLGSHVGQAHKSVTKEFEDLSKTKRRQVLLAERGHICWRCSTKEWMGEPVPLQMDHIDGNPFNDSRSNVRLLCANCHSQTDTFAGRNKGSGNPPRTLWLAEVSEWRRQRKPKPKFTKEDVTARDERRKYNREDIAFWFGVSKKTVIRYETSQRLDLQITSDFMSDLQRIQAQIASHFKKTRIV